MLQTINGVDLDALQNSGRATAGASGLRVAGLPMLLRTYVEPEGGTKKGPKPNLPSLSECDALFYATMLHLWNHIPYCHVHIVVPADLFAEKCDQQDGFLSWGRTDLLDDGTFGSAHAVTNDSPYPAPQSSGRQSAAAVQAHLEVARRLFEVCPNSTQLRISMSPSVPGCEDLLAEGDHRVLGITPLVSQGGDPSTFARIKKRLHQRADKRRRKQARRQGLTLAQDEQPGRPLYVNNINSQRLHCSFRTLYGKDEMAIEHADIMPDERCSVSLPADVDVSLIFGVATSVDLQHLELGPLHLVGLSRITEMPVLTHVNLNHNHLGDAGIDALFKALVDAGSSVVHIAASDNNIGDEGATSIALNLGSLPRLTSLELCDNFIQEHGSINLAEAIGGMGTPTDEGDMDDIAPVGPLGVLSVDLKGNRSRELGARRWAEVICNHPDLKFLCLAQNELALMTKERFLDLVCAAVASAALSVLDLQDNFPQPLERGKNARTSMGPPPAEVVEELLADLPPGEFDPAEVRRAVFIRRQRGAAGAGAGQEKMGRQPQQGQQQGRERHSTAGVPPASPAGSATASERP